MEQIHFEMLQKIIMSSFFSFNINCKVEEHLNSEVKKMFLTLNVRLTVTNGQLILCVFLSL